MHKRFGVWIVVAVLVLLAVLKGPQWMAFGRGVQAYLYAYPLITADVSKHVMTSPEAVAMHRPGSAPLNQLSNAREFPDSHFTDVVAPNADTLYSIAWLDLSREPMLLHTPDMQGRWLLMELLDGWSNAFGSLGTRTYGFGERTYALVGPGWNGTLPPGVVRIDSPTEMVWLVGRTYTAGTADYDAVHKVQDQYSLIPLSQYDKPEFAPAANAAANKPVDVKTPVVTQVAALGTGEYFARLARLMKDNPPAAADAPMLAKLASFGIAPGKAFDIDALPPAQRRGLDDASWFVKAFFDVRAPGTQGALEVGPVSHALFGGASTLVNKIALNSHNGWAVPLNIGVYGTNYPLRALVTLLGFGANTPVDAVYPMTMVDADSQALNGGQRYLLHFDKTQIPPAKAFWSITMYNEKGFFIDNPIRRYAIGDRDHLAFNADGSLDILIQTASPGPGQESNWLPAPLGKFKLFMRLYQPADAVLNGSWVPPGVRRINTQ